MPFPALGDLPDPGIEPASPASQADSLLSEPPDAHYTILYLRRKFKKKKKVLPTLHQTIVKIHPARRPI